MNRHVIFYHSPQSRSAGALALLEELNADYELHSLNLPAKEQRQAEYLKINPMGKVPAILHDEALITEQVAVFLYMADLYAEAKLAPPIGDPLRGPYLRWMAFYGSCFEPALIDKSLKREPADPSVCPYGDYDTTVKTVMDQLAKGPYLLGEQFSAVDVLWGTALAWTTAFGLVPKTPVVEAYIERVTSRPAAKRAQARDAELLAAREKAKSS
ncbi:glutathione S-transferase N-terminal domain-containing protein [Oxalobacteraceae bacterium]|nr:glutathione S-transferase N-terminal domain-containing protein [Oxalobacteraceae bacterium]